MRKPLLSEDSIEGFSRSLLPSNGAQVNADRDSNYRTSSTTSVHASTVPTTPGRSICDIIQFTAAIYYVEEDEEALRIDIMRLGDLKESCKVSYQTEDASAKAGVKYIPAQGTLEFAPGEYAKKIDVSVINDSRFDTTLEFKVNLSNPENCVLGRYLYTCRVKIIDDDLFPTNKYQDELVAHKIEAIPPMKLMWEYFRLIFNLPGMKVNTILILIFDQLHNLYYLLTTCLLVYMVDVLFNLHSADENLIFPGDRQSTTILCAILYVVPFTLLHFWDVKKTKMDLPAKEWLQGAIFRRYLNYTEESRQVAPPSAIALAVIDEATEVVDGGYMRLFNISQAFGKLAIIIGFVALQNHAAVLPILLFLPALLIWIKLRNKTYVELGEDIAKQKMRVVHTVHLACHNYRLIADYHQRPHMIGIFDKELNALNDRQGPMDLTVLHNQYFPYYLSSISTALYILLFAGQVFDGTLSLGTFIAMINVFAQLGDDFEEGYDEMMAISGAIGPLQQIVKFMNLETDLRRKKKVNRLRRKRTREITNDLMGQNDNEPDTACSSIAQRPRAFSASIRCVSDKIPIQCKGVKFKYDGRPENDWLITADDLVVPQGSIVAVVGPRKSGKSTFLKLMSQINFPQAGEIFIPTHLRVLNVSFEPSLMQMGLYENLAFGDENCDPDRVRRILTRLGLQGLLETIERELSEKHVYDDESDELQALSYTDSCMLHLARALIANPEVMVLHRPFTHFDRQTQDLFMEVLRETVSNCGFEMDPATIQHRRPRTVFFSTDFEYIVNRADFAWRVDNGNVDLDQRNVTWSPGNSPSSSSQMVTPFKPDKIELQQLNQSNGEVDHRTVTRFKPHRSELQQLSQRSVGLRPEAKEDPRLDWRVKAVEDLEKLTRQLSQIGELEKGADPNLASTAAQFDHDRRPPFLGRSLSKEGGPPSRELARMKLDQRSWHFEAGLQRRERQCQI